MIQYASELTLLDARQRYFDQAGFNEDGYSDRWVRLKAGPIVFGFPNTQARVRAVKFHDLHHVLTEYDTTWPGEAQIGAWEIASGCGRHYPAWLLNMAAVAVGLIIAPRAVYAAFIRGRKSTNLYRSAFDGALLQRTVGEVRGELALDGPYRPTTGADRVAFVGWMLAAAVVTLAPYVLAALVAATVLHHILE